MPSLCRAKPSPRVENGTLYWYYGDTFLLRLQLKLKDCQGFPVELSPEDSLELVIRNLRQDPVAEFRFTGEDLASGSIGLVMDADRSALLTPGAYSYDVYLHHDRRVTLAKQNRIYVEGRDGEAM